MTNVLVKGLEHTKIASHSFYVHLFLKLHVNLCYLGTCILCIL